jgi:hypothetical protein
MAASIDVVFLARGVVVGLQGHLVCKVKTQSAPSWKMNDGGALIVPSLVASSCLASSLGLLRILGQSYNESILGRTKKNMLGPRHLDFTHVSSLNNAQNIMVKSSTHVYNITYVSQ